MKKGSSSQDRIWLTWETQTRNRSLSSEMGAVLHEKDPKLISLFRYPYLVLSTIFLLLTNKAKIVFVQNPSLILSFTTILFGKIILKKHVIIDAHNIALEPITGSWRFLEPVRVFVIKNASYTIVSNEELVGKITTHKGKPLVLPDPLPTFSDLNTQHSLTGTNNILYICSWAADEPYCEVIRAASLLDKSTKIYITGNNKDKYTNCMLDIAENVILTGFISTKEFETLLVSVDVVVDLTTRESCLLCGAYEGVSAEKPMLLSDTRALRKYFFKGAAYTDNTAEDIAKKINMLLTDKKYQNEIINLKDEIKVEWQKQKNIINNAIESLETVN